MAISGVDRPNNRIKWIIWYSSGVTEEYRKRCDSEGAGFDDVTGHRNSDLDR